MLPSSQVGLTCRFLPDIMASPWTQLLFLFTVLSALSILTGHHGQPLDAAFVARYCAFGLPRVSDLSIFAGHHGQRLDAAFAAIYHASDLASRSNPSIFTGSLGQPSAAGHCILPHNSAIQQWNIGFVEAPPQQPNAAFYRII